MTRLCLDTSAYSNFRRGHAQAADLVDAAEWIGMPSVVIGELWTGFLLGARRAENIRELDEFLNHAVVEIVSIDEEVAHIYGDMVVELRQRGRPMPTNDIWIAATTARSGGTLLTFDEHFHEIARVGTLVL